MLKSNRVRGLRRVNIELEKGARMAKRKAKKALFGGKKSKPFGKKKRGKK